MLTPQALAAALGLPRPTDEQAAVIAAPASSALVVAGAGAGKTETMAARVVWLVATGQVLPEQVLGLTFTRKAAQQLGVRVRTRLRRLAGSRLLDDLDPSGERRAAVLAGEPTIATYHAYAGRLVGEHALRLPAEPGARLLGSTGAWQLAHRVVTSWADDLDVDRVPATVTGYVLALAGELGEHLVEPGAVADARGGARGAARPGPARAAAAGRAVPALPAMARGPADAARARPARPGLRRAQARRARARLRRPARHRRPRGRRAPGGRGAGTGHLPGRAARRVPGHRPRAAGAPARAVRCGARRPGRAGRPGRHRGRRPLPVDLRLARGERGQPAALPHRLPRPGRRARRRVRPAHQLPEPARGAGAGERRVRPAAQRPGSGRRRRAGRPGRARRRATSASRCCRTSPRSWTGRPTRRRAVARRGGPRARSRPPRRSWCGAGPTWTPSPPRCAPATCPWRWSGSAACSTPPRCATS